MKETSLPRSNRIRTTVDKTFVAAFPARDPAFGRALPTSLNAGSSLAARLLEVGRLTQNVAKCVPRRCAMEGISPAALSMLHVLNESESMSLTELATASSLAKGTASKSFKKLLSLGLVHLHRAGKRPLAASISGEGRKLAQASEELHGLQSPFRALTERELSDLHALLARADCRS